MSRLPYLLLFLSACASTEPHPFTAPVPPWEDNAKIVIVGDLQRTSLLEFWREQNDAERERIVAGITAARPDLLVLLGDLVFHGGSNAHWARFDELVAPIRDTGVSTWPVPGNHEYWLGSDLDSYFARFSLLDGRRWYSLTYGPLGLVFLDGNDHPLGCPGWRDQMSWLKHELTVLDSLPAIRAVLVFVHQPPYTNSSITSDEKHIQESVVPFFNAAAKTVMLASGHVHSYERFERLGRTFVVSGGGGGPRARLREGEDRPHADDLCAGPALRDFHWLEIRIGIAGLEVTVVGLKKGRTTFYPMDRFCLPWPLARVTQIG